MAVAGTLLALTGQARAALRVVESIAFEAPLSTTVYLGAAGRSVRYVGVRSDAQIYLGPGALF